MSGIKRVILKKGEERRILLGHPWVFDNEVAAVLEGFGSGAREAALEAGGIADVESSRREYLGRAFVNPASKIVARIYSPSKEGVDTGFFKWRIREALERREFEARARGGAAFAEEDAARLVFAEADFLPGLIIDRFRGAPAAAFEEGGAKKEARVSCLVMQLLTYGMDARRDMILQAIQEVFAGEEPLCVIEKSDAPVRLLEGLPLRQEVLKGTPPEGGVVIREHGYPFIAPLADAQKTGCFIDQKHNRLIAARLAAARAGALPAGRHLRALDAFCYTGGFSIHIARGVPEAEITACDSSASALETLQKNARMNGVSDQITCVKEDVFSLLGRYEREKRRFDCVVLDPPAFAKTHSALPDALRGYKEINARALRLLDPGGVLVSCSCSQVLSESRFERMILEAASSADRRLYRLDVRVQAGDHPVLMGYDESCYLKAGFYRVK